jgi:hypothetical protein
MTLRGAMWTLSVIALLLSLAHLSFAAVDAMDGWSLAVLWFAGSGLAILLAALLNVVALRSGVADPVTRSVWLFSNVVMGVFFALAWPLLPEPHTAVGFVVFALLAVGAGLLRARAKSGV